MRFLLLLIVLSLVACQDENPNALTAEDVAWATGSNIWKIDLSDAGAIDELQMVLMDASGNELETSSSISFGQFAQQARVAYQKEGSGILGRFGYPGSSIDFKFEDFPSGPVSTSFAEPERRGDYFIFTEEVSSRSNGAVVNANPRTLALKLLREAKEP